MTDTTMTHDDGGFSLRTPDCGADEVMLQIISKLMGTMPRLGNR